MNVYRVLLTRSYVVTIQAKSEEDALRLSEFYIGGEKDLSLAKEKELEQFDIEGIEMTFNEAIEVEQSEEKI